MDISELRRLVEELVEVMSVLNEDEQICQIDSRLDGDRAQFWRRTLTRSFFAQVEGSCHRMKQFAESAAQFYGYHRLSDREKARIDNLLYDDDSGQITNQPSYPSIPSNVEFALNIFAKVNGKNIHLDKGQEPRWESFRKSIDLRNRLTHPEKSSDLIVSDRELALLRESSEWYKEKIDEARKIGLSRAQEELDDMLDDLVDG